MFPHCRLAVLVVGLAAVADRSAAQEFTTPLELRRVATWASPRLRESSGVAVSRTHRGLLWTHNDSGDGPNLYLADTAGTLRAVFEVRGARAVDWEGLTLGPCVPARWSGRTCLYIADTGDNEERRTRVALYAVPEPEPLPPDGTPGITEIAQRLRLRYADRPRDAEALAALPDGSLALVTKGRTGPVLRFTIPAGAWDADEFVLDGPDTLPINPQMALGRWVTDATMHPDGQHVVVRTYTELYRFRIGDRWAAAGPPCRLGLVEPQGEGVGFLDAEWMVLTSERAGGIPGSITLVRCPWN